MSVPLPEPDDPYGFLRYLADHLPSAHRHVRPCDNRGAVRRRLRSAAFLRYGAVPHDGRRKERAQLSSERAGVQESRGSQSAALGRWSAAPQATHARPEAARSNLQRMTNRQHFAILR
jgi:hypothetical protein